MSEKPSTEQLNAVIAELYIENRKLAEDADFWCKLAMQRKKEVEDLQAEKGEIEGDFLNLREAFDKNAKTLERLENYVATLGEGGIVNESIE